MIGLGSDLIDIRRIEKTLLRFGDRFKTRVFTDKEIKKCDKRKESAASVSYTHLTLPTMIRV